MLSENPSPLLGESESIGTEDPRLSVHRASDLRWSPWGILMRVILDVVQGPLKGRQFVLDRQETYIVGRSRFVQCPMPEDLALSRDHFMIDVNPPECELRDLGSTNGTYINNNRVAQRMRLGSGDTIAAGQSVFRVRVEVAGNPSSGDDLSEATLRTHSLEINPICCAGCGTQAPGT